MAPVLNTMGKIEFSSQLVTMLQIHESYPLLNLEELNWKKLLAMILPKGARLYCLSQADKGEFSSQMFKRTPESEIHENSL